MAGESWAHLEMLGAWCAKAAIFLDCLEKAAVAFGTGKMPSRGSCKTKRGAAKVKKFHEILLHWRKRILDVWGKTSAPSSFRLIHSHTLLWARHMFAPWEVNGRCSAFQQWKRLALQRKTAVTGECCRNSQFLRSSFYSWSQSVKISKFALKLDVKLTSFLQRGVWRLWRHAIQIELTQRKVHKHLAEAFHLWRITSVSALQSLHLGESELEVSASTVVESGKDTEAPDDVNRTLSDLSGLTLTEGSPILPGLAFESSPEDLLKTYSQLIPHPASPKVKGISLEKLQELRVPSTFQGDRGASTPQASQASQASHLVFLPSPVRSRQPTPVSTPSDGSYSNMLTPPPWPVDALKAAGVERQSNQRERRWQSNILKTWLGVCLQKKKLSVDSWQTYACWYCAILCQCVRFLCWELDRATEPCT